MLYALLYVLLLRVERKHAKHAESLSHAMSLSLLLITHVLMFLAEKTAEVETPDITPPKVEEEPLIEEVSTIKGQVSVSKDGTITIYRDGKIVKIAGKLRELILIVG